MKYDVVELSKELISFPSVTPEDKGCIKFLSDILETLGFKCNVLEFGDKNITVRNLYARRGTTEPNLCFAGHVDVVPPGNLGKWTYPPFSPEINNGILYGRGAIDMKCAICAFIAAISEINVKDITGGSVSLIITGDEEGQYYQYGTKAVLEWLVTEGEKIDFCVVGEPTSNSELGDTVKIGRRGSVTFELKCYGIQGHVAYPELAENPINNIVNILYKIDNTVLDRGNENFQPSNCEVTTIDTNNPTDNIIPYQTVCRMNIRFNTEHTAGSLEYLYNQICGSVTQKYTLTPKFGGESFITKTDYRSDIMLSAIEKCTGKKAEYSTGGGTSDARFIKDYCPVIEFGLINKTAHHIDENTSICDLYKLTAIYKEFVTEFFTIKLQ